MSQKLTDIKLIIQNDRRVWAAAGFIVVAIFIWLLTDDRGGSRRVALPDDKASRQGAGSTEAFQDLIQAFKNDIDQQKKNQQEMNTVLTRTSQDLKEHKEKVTGIFETMVDKFEALAREVDALAAALKQQQDITPPPDRRELEGPDTLEPFGLEEPQVAPPPPEPAPQRVSVIAPGDSVSVQLLTGVNAPVDGTPYPVVFQLNGPIEGPDGSTLELGEARLVAAAQGSEADSRALYRLSSLSIRHPSGRRSVIKVDGWVVGEDGIRGMKGKLIDKLGRLILATAGVSFAAALGERIEGRETNVRRDGGLRADPQDFDYATASALTDASNRLGQVLLNRYEALVPVVEILPNREAVAIFSQTAEIEVLDEDLSEAAYAAID